MNNFSLSNKCNVRNEFNQKKTKQMLLKQAQ